MLTNPVALPLSQEWQALKKQREALQSTSMLQLFAEDPDRAQRFYIEGAGLALDFSKNRITNDTLNALVALAHSRELEDRRHDLLSGEKVNFTENRPALHTALRHPGNDTLLVDGADIIAEVHYTLNRMETFVQSVWNHTKTGYSGKTFTDIVSIGIGGSYLGPKLVSEALQPYWHANIRCHYVANIDGSDICETLRRVNPETTLFLIQSKSFTTEETLENAKVARTWFMQKGGDEEAVSEHFVAVTANVAAAEAFGMSAENVFPMWDWVGGRYSLWSAIGLPVALIVGMDNFRNLLAGAHAMDTHFRDTPLEQNLPVVMALLSVWYSNFWGAATHAILPYDHYLRNFPAHLQQLDMESNGKMVNEAGEQLTYDSGTIVWGGVGSNGQHAYHQLLHQGTRLIPADFIISLTTHNPVASHHARLYASCLSQTQALMTGKSLEKARAELSAQGLSDLDIERLAPHKVVPGNKPSNTLLMDKVTPRSLGALVALYEHKTFVQGVIWGLDPFDQWGVELGKQLGSGILSHLLNESIDNQASDSSTAHLIKLFRLADSA